MKLKIKERADGSRYHVWDAEQSTPAMVVFGVNWATTIVLMFTGKISAGLGGLAILFTLVVILPLLITVMNRFARRVPIPPDYDRIAELHRLIYPACPRCRQPVLPESHECAEPTEYERWYSRKPEPPEWGSATSAEVHAYNEAKLRWARQRPAEGDEASGGPSVSDYEAAWRRWQARKPMRPVGNPSVPELAAWRQAKDQWLRDEPQGGFWSQIII